MSRLDATMDEATRLPKAIFSRVKDAARSAAMDPKSRRREADVAQGCDTPRLAR
jgi:hypothetical protein